MRCPSDDEEESTTRRTSTNTRTRTTTRSTTRTSQFAAKFANPANLQGVRGKTLELEQQLTLTHTGHLAVTPKAFLVLLNNFDFTFENYRSFWFRYFQREDKGPHDREESSNRQ